MKAEIDGLVGERIDNVTAIGESVLSEREREKEREREQEWERERKRESKSERERKREKLGECRECEGWGKISKKTGWAENKNFGGLTFGMSWNENWTLEPSTEYFVAAKTKQLQSKLGFLITIKMFQPLNANSMTHDRYCFLVIVVNKYKVFTNIPSFLYKTWYLVVIETFIRDCKLKYWYH